MPKSAVVGVLKRLATCRCPFSAAFHTRKEKYDESTDATRFFEIVRNIIYWVGSCGLWYHTHTNRNIFAYKYAFANKYSIADCNCNADANFNTDSNCHFNSDIHAHTNTIACIY